MADLEAAKAALVLAKIYLRQGKVMAASDVLENNVYGPVKILDRLQGNQDFSSDVYGVDLQVLVQRMALEPDQADALLQRGNRCHGSTARERSGTRRPEETH